MVTDMSYFGLNEDRGPPSQRGHKSVQVQWRQFWLQDMCTKSMMAGFYTYLLSMHKLNLFYTGCLVHAFA